MNMHARLAITVVVLFHFATSGLAQEGKQAQIQPVAVTVDGEAPAWKGCMYINAGGDLYCVTSAGLWRMSAGKAERVKKPDGSDFVPVEVRRDTFHQWFVRIDNGLVASAKDEASSNAIRRNCVAFMVRGVVAKPLLQSDGSPIVYSDVIDDTDLPLNPMLSVRTESGRQSWLVSGETATPAALPQEASIPALAIVDGRLLIRGGENGKALWILDKGQWVRVTDTKGKPLEVPASPAYGRVTVTGKGSYIALPIHKEQGFSVLIMRISGTKAEPISLPEGFSKPNLFSMGNRVIVIDWQDGKQIQLELDGTRHKSVKGAPKGCEGLLALDAFGIAYAKDSKGNGRHYRLDDKGSREFKVPQGVALHQPVFYPTTVNGQVFVQSDNSADGGDTKLFWILDAKVNLVPVSVAPWSGDASDDRHWRMARDGAFIVSISSGAPPVFVPAG